MKIEELLPLKVYSSFTLTLFLQAYLVLKATITTTAYNFINTFSLFFRENKT